MIPIQFAEAAYEVDVEGVTNAAMDWYLWDVAREVRKRIREFAPGVSREPSHLKGMEIKMSFRLVGVSPPKGPWWQPSCSEFSEYVHTRNH